MTNVQSTRIVLGKPIKPTKWTKADSVGHLVGFIPQASEEVESFNKDGTQLRVTAAVIDLDAGEIVRDVHIFGALATNVDGPAGVPLVGRVVEGQATQAGWSRPFVLDEATGAEESRFVKWLETNATTDAEGRVVLNEDASFAEEEEPF
jgi:hypothetical protein